MKTARWIASFPSAVLASLLVWILETKIFSGMHATYGGGLFYSFLGLVPITLTSAIPPAVFVLAGTVIVPTTKRGVCFVFLALSLMFSAGGIPMLLFQNGALPFWLASVAGIVTGAFIGLAVSLRVQRPKKPVQLPVEP